MKRILIICSLMIFCASCGGMAQDGAMIRAYKNFEKGDYEDVLILTSQAQSYRKPSHQLMAEILFLRALALEKLGRDQEAQGVFKFIAANFMDTEYGYRAEQKVEMKPDDALIYYKWGMEYVNKNQFDKAISQLDKSIELDPGHALSYFYRGIAFWNKGRIDMAFSDFNRSIELNPDYAFAYYNRGCLYGQKGDADRAFSDLNKSISLDPEFAPAYFNRALLYKMQNRIDEAISDHTRSIELNPGFAPAYYERADLYKRQNYFEKAISDYLRAIELNPEHAAAYNDLAYFLATCPDDRYRDGAKAIELAEKALELNKDNYFIMDTLAAAYAEAGRFEDAAALQEKVVRNLQKKQVPEKMYNTCVKHLNSYKANKPWREE